MRHRSRPFPKRLIAAPAALLALCGASAPASTVVTVTVTGLRSEAGVVLACMTADPHDFPSCRDADGAYSAMADAAGTVVFTFRDVRPGLYAVALLHDENENGKADRAALMIPREGFGFSRDAKVRMGPPRFRDAAFEVGTKPERIAIRMRYML